MNILHELIEWVKLQSVFGQIMLGLVTFLVVVTVAFYVAEGLRWLFKPKGVRPERIPTEAEKALAKYGRIEPGLTVHIFHRTTGEMVQLRNDRYSSDDERDPLFYVQIKALNQRHAMQKFRQIHPEHD